MKTADVTILGAGPNGLAMALALGGSRLPRPLTVNLVDRRDPLSVPQDSRGTAVTRATQNMFKALGLWTQLESHAEEMRQVIVTDGAGSHDGCPSLLTFLTDAGDKAAATIVENAALAAALVAEVERSPAISRVSGFSFALLTQNAGHVVITSETGESIKSRLLIAADGRNSRIRAAAGIAVSEKSYGQTALAFSISHELPHAGMAQEHFAPEGVFAVLPLPGNRASIVWGTSTERSAQLMALDDQAFNTALQEQMGTRLGTVKLEGRRGAYPLERVLAEHFTSNRVALIGDAAHAIHPLAGLGLNLGFKDAAVLADLVAHAFALGSDIGGASVLDAYQTARRGEVQITTLAMDAMNGLFANDNPALKSVRGLGLRLVDQLRPVKDLLMHEASGLATGNPRLMRGLLPG